MADSGSIMGGGLRCATMDRGVWSSNGWKIRKAIPEAGLWLGGAIPFRINQELWPGAGDNRLALKRTASI